MSPDLHMRFNRHCRCRMCAAARTEERRARIVVVLLLLGGILFAVGFSKIEGLREAVGW